MILLQLHGLAAHVPLRLWGQALRAPDEASPGQLAFHYVLMPRFAVALLCGAALALASTILQQVMRNPLAEPTTLGISAGAGLALNVFAVFLPSFASSWGREWIAFTGAAGAALVVFGLSLRASLSPLSLILSGMLVTLFCGAISAWVQILDNPYNISFFLWSAGSLVQQDWGEVYYLLPRCLILAVIAGLLARPLAVLSLEEEGSRALGLGLGRIRAAALAVAACLTAAVVSSVGIIGFIGLAAPALARSIGANRIASQLIWSPLIGAVLLGLTDQLVQLAFGEGREWIPTGAATALIGAPLLLWLAPRLRAREVSTHQPMSRPARRPTIVLAVFVVLLAACMFSSLHIGKVSGHFHWWSSTELHGFWRWRGPRMAGAAGAGALLAGAGALLQRITGNPLASPEMLGINDGAALGMTVAVTMVGSAGWPGALIGAAAMLALILWRASGTDSAPERLLITGLAVNALAGVGIVIIMIAGGHNMANLRLWLLGDTAEITVNNAVFVCIFLVFIFPAVLLCRRWLLILPLGHVTAKAMGANPSRSRFAVLSFVVVMTAIASMIVGPLGFVGLMGAHLARFSGLQQPIPQFFGAALLGALLLVLADWASRTMIAPYELPAGLISALAGGAYLMVLLLCQRTGLGLKG